MKLGFVITNISFSGAQNVFNALIGELQNRGHRIYVFATNERADIKEIDSRIYGLLEESGVRYIGQLKKVQKINRYVKDLNLDALVAFGFNSNIKAIIASLYTRIPVFISDRMDPKSFPGKTDYLLRFQRWALYRFSTGLIVQTQEIKQFYNERMQRKISVIPNPVRVPSSVCYANQEREKIIVTVTRLDEKQKNLLHLINSFDDFYKNHNDYSLAIVGDGPDKAVLQRRICELGLEKVIKLTGRIDNPSSFVKTCDFFTLVSIHEGMPNALIEAMSLGIPCVVEHFSGGAAEELIENEVNGLLLPTHDQTSLVTAFDRLAKSEDLKIKLGNNAYKINHELALPRIAEQWERIIQKTVS